MTKSTPELVKKRSSTNAFQFAEQKEVLKGVSGEFRGFELSAVVGQSGSGKTSLLQVLSGYTTKSISGSIRINDDENIQGIQKRSNFIMQNYTLHHFITVREAMKFAANLKLHSVSEAYKSYKVSCEFKSD